MKKLIIFFAMLLGSLTAFAKDTENPEKGSFSALTSIQEDQYLRDILLNPKLSGASFYAENFIQDCKSSKRLELSKLTTKSFTYLVMNFICNDDPSHQSRVQIMLNKNNVLDNATNPIVSFEVE